MMRDDRDTLEQRRRRRGIRWTVTILVLIAAGFYLAAILGYLRG